MAASDSFYLEILEEVNNVLNELGTTYQVRGNSTYDSDTLTTTNTPPREVVGLVASQEMVHSIAGISLILPTERAYWIGKKSLLLSASSLPQAEEEVLVDGKWFPLNKVETIKPADVTVLFLLDVSR
jgi:hypothetical protein